MAFATLAEAPLAPYARVKKYLKEGLAEGRFGEGGDHASSYLPKLV